MTSQDKLSPVTGGWQCCLETDMQCVPPPSLGPDRASQMCSSPLCSQPLGLGSVLLPHPTPPRGC